MRKEITSENINKLIKDVKKTLQEKDIYFLVNSQLEYDFYKASESKIPKDVYERKIMYLKYELKGIKQRAWYKIGRFLRII